MKFPTRTPIPLLALGAILSGCSCGTYHPEAGKSARLPSASPSGTFTSNSSDDPQVKCDTKRNCTMTFKDGVTAGVTWTVDFTLDSVGQSTAYPRRDL